MRLAGKHWGEKDHFDLLPLVGVFLCLLAIFLWWRAGYAEQQASRDAQAERSAFLPTWNYLRQRLEESEITPPAGTPPPEETS